MFALLMPALAAVLCGSCQEPAGGWAEVAPGLELGRFPAGQGSGAAAEAVTVVRIDPARWDLQVHGSSARDRPGNLTVAGWCRELGLVAAVNAGMFDIDYRTHTGYLRCRDHVNNPNRNGYQSVSAFGPRRAGLPRFRIFALDETEFAAIDGDYDCVIQNLRLIKRPRENRWQQQPKKWSEVALGEDARGRALFIFCRRPFSMHDLNRILLDLPLDLVCAQHLEGGPEAQLYLQLGEREIELVGTFEAAFGEGEGNTFAWPVPNVIGVVPRSDLPRE